jgi:DNA mismatch repair protein MutS2
MATLDALQARALLARDMAASCPEVADELRLDLKEARHPLLIAALTEPLGMPRRSTREPVPVSIRVEPEKPVLVISGPNTGGKTVALKATGLLVLMAQCGLHVPASEGSVVPAFRSVFADIGDDQSIVADLSTFSAHLANIVEMTRLLALPALVLLDEVGSGTEPSQGGALGVAIVDHFRESGAMVLATTHHGLMKTYAQTTPGVVCASFGYEPSTYAPTYRLSIGTPGRSLALEMAERLGLPDDILAAARARLDRREADLEELERRLELERAELAADMRRAAEERQRLEAERNEHERLLAELEGRKRQEVGTFLKQLERRSAEAFERADQAVRQTLARLEAARGNALRAAAHARREAHQAFEAARSEAFAESGLEFPQAPAAGPLKAGTRVRIVSLGGVVGTLLQAPLGEQAEVDVGGKRLRLPAAELTAVAGPPGGGRASPPGASAPKTAPAEINIIGLTVEEALPRVDKLLDDAILSDTTRLRVIHGHGAGRLRRAVRELLEGHPHVSAFHAGDPREGGSGVTIVELRS